MKIDKEFKPEEVGMETDTLSEAQPKEKKSLKENLYDKIPFTVKQMDIIIVILVILFFVFLLVGALKGNGIL